MAETQTKTNKEKAVKLFTQDLPKLDVRQTTNYKVALTIKEKLLSQNKVPAFLVSSILASMWVNVTPKVYREEKELVEACADGLASYLGNLYVATQQDFDSEVFRSMAKSMTFVLDW